MKRVILIVTSIFLFATINTFFQNVKCEETTTNTLYVGGNAAENYNTIQSAIDNASIGDTIFVYNGTYFENINVNKSIKLIGEDKETTIVNGNINKTNEDILICFYVSSDQVNINGFTIESTKKVYESNNSSIFGIGILIKANNTIIQGNIIRENTFGISLDNSYSNKIIENVMADNYIHINLLGSSYNTIENSTITNYNQSDFLDLNNKIGISLDIAYDNSIINNTISNISGIGIQLSNLCENNSIYFNNFMNNTENANDFGNNNWDNGKYGNFWDDYNGSDKNNDGVGDSPYIIPNGSNEDRFPLMMPYDGTFRLKEFYVDIGSVLTMLLIGMVVIIIFLIPIAYYWNKKTKI